MKLKDVKKKLDLLREDLQINRNMLDQHLIEQPQLFYAVSALCAGLVSVRDQAKDDLKTLEAEISLRLRRHAEQQSKKTTEATIAAEVESDDERKEMKVYLLECMHQCDTAQALKEAYTQRSYVLKDLVSLYGSDYFVKSAVKANSEEAALVQRRLRRGERK